MGVRVKKQRRGTAYHKLLIESRKETGVHYHRVGNNEQMALNPLKHLACNKPYKNEQCKKMLKDTLRQYNAYLESVQNGNTGRPVLVEE